MRLLKNAIELRGMLQVQHTARVIKTIDDLVAEIKLCHSIIKRYPKVQADLMRCRRIKKAKNK